MVCCTIRDQSRKTCAQAKPQAASGLAVHPDLAFGNVGQAGGQLVDGDVHGAGDVREVPFLVAAHVQDHHGTVMPDLRQVREVRNGVAAQRPAAGPVTRMPGGGRGQPVDADPDQLPLGLGDLLGRVAEQGQRRPTGSASPGM